MLTPFSFAHNVARRRVARSTVARCSRGTSLIEVLVVLVISAIGLLGLAGLLVASVRYNQTAYLRSMATQMAADLADRMRANFAATRDSGANPYGYAVSYDTSAAASVATANCAPNCTGAQKATNDLAQWNALLRAQLPGGAGAVLGNFATRFQIVVMWREPSADTAQAVALFGSGCPNTVAAPSDVRCFVTEVMP